MAKLTIIICALFISTAVADEWRLNLNYPSGHNSFRYSSGTLKDKSHHRKYKNFKDRHRKHHRVKPYPPYWRYPGSWYGYPKLRPWHDPSNSRKKTVIIKEKEVIREIPVIIQPPEPEKVWVLPVYEEKVIQGHYTSGIKEWVDEEGYRNFKDDDSKKVWVPEQTIRIIKNEGYWK